MTTASKITLIRVAMIPAFMLAFLLSPGHTWLKWLALGIFILASLTDFVDGQIARKYNQVSDFGKFLDPLADKLLVIAAMCVFCQWGLMPAWALVIVLTREFSVTGLRLIAVERQRVIAAAPSGKIKTAATMVCLALMLLVPAPGVGDSAPDLTAQLSSAVIVLTTVYSGAEYFVKNRDVFKDVD